MKFNLFKLIQSNRTELLNFLSKKEFVGKQSFSFVYYQLKCYYDLIQLSKHPKLNQFLAETIRKDVRLLEEGLRDWKNYALVLEVKQQ